MKTNGKWDARRKLSPPASKHLQPHLALFTFFFTSLRIWSIFNLFWFQFWSIIKLVFKDILGSRAAPKLIKKNRLRTFVWNPSLSGVDALQVRLRSPCELLIFLLAAYKTPKTKCFSNIIIFCVNAAFRYPLVKKWLQPPYNIRDSKVFL